MAKAQRAPKSPYQKYNKTPHVYSVDYQEWRAEVKKNGACTTKAIALACQHAKTFRIKNAVCSA